MPGPRKVKAATKRGIDAHVRETARIADILVEAAKKDAEPVLRVPGAVVNGQKISWTRRDMDNYFPKVTFTPEEDLSVTYNGVGFRLLVGRETTVPKPIKVIYDDWRKSQRDLGNENSLRLGVGALEPEAT